MEAIQEFLKKMHCIRYGWIDKEGNEYINKIVKNKFMTDYYLQSPKEVWKNEIGICWDQVEVEREFFEEHNIAHQSIFMFYDDGVKFPIHTFMLFKKDNKYGWIDNTYSDVKDSIRIYPSLKAAINDVTKEFIKENKLSVIGEKVYYYVYEKPTYGLNFEGFVTYCRNGKLADPNFKNIDTWD